MPHIDTMFPPSEYMSAVDLGAKEFTLTIESITPSEVMSPQGKADKRPIIKFKEAKKKFVLNKTNKTICQIRFGSETNDWIGKTVTLYATTCKSFGNPNTPCIRIK